jgi:dTDP-4-dehydrorhamnose 3,5-epimerase-like enzyme
MDNKALNDKIRIIDRTFRSDSRGWFLKALTGLEEFITSGTGEIYLTMAHPGQWRANHYHYRADEWFTVFAGKARVILEDVQTKERMELMIEASSPKTVFAPAGVAHVFINASQTEPMILVAYANETYDPSDTFPYDLIG